MKRILFLFGLLVCLAGMPLTAFADNKTAKQTYETAISDNWKTMLKNSDAHFTTAVGEHGRAEALLKELNFPEELIANYHPEILKEYIPDLADFRG